MPRLEQLSIYLLKPTITSGLSAISDTADFEKIRSIKGAPKGSLVLIRSNPPHDPAWLKFFPERTREAMRSLSASSAGALFLLPVASRWFALSFGTGWHLLKKDSFVRSFGLRVALSVVKRDTLKSVDVSTYETFAKHSRVNTSRGTTIDSFDIDGQLDLLRGVIGDCGLAPIGEHIGGKDSCVVWTRVTFDRVPKLCRLLLRLYESPRVQKRFPIIDNIAEIRDPAELLQLDELLDRELLANPHHDVSIAPPEVVDWQDVPALRLTCAGAPAPSVSLSFPEVQKLFHPDPPTCRAMAGIRIGTVKPDGAAGNQEWTLYDCVVTEVGNPADPTYKCILLAGKWYRVAATLIAKVNSELAAIATHARSLPDAAPLETEGEYNARFAATDPANLVLLDKKNISYGGGASRVEVCDVLSTASCLYHVKAYNGSATLSHLFSQGTVSARLLLEPDFRAELLQRYPALPPSMIRTSDITASQIEVTFAIICEPARDLPNGLPFFSKVRLVEACRELRRMGFPASLARVVRNETESH
jgi:uncharacterized protein (TIGR04141 family)